MNSRAHLCAPIATPRQRRFLIALHQGRKRSLQLVAGEFWFVPLLLTFVLCVGAGLSSVRAEAAYVATELASLPEGSNRVVRGLNDAGEVVGGARLGNRHRGFLRDSDALQSIEGLPGSDYSVALGLNNLGDIVGSANTPTGMRAFRSRRAGAAADLGPLPGDSSSIAFGINNEGETVGYSSGPTGVRAVVWSLAGAIRALPALPDSDSSRALAINDAGDVVGVSDISSGSRAVRWRDGVAHDLGALPGHSVSEALNINNSGEIVGSSGDPAVERHAVLWSPGGLMQDLGTLPGGASSRALGINDRGEVVGTSQSSVGSQAFLWTPRNGMQDLNGLLISRPEFVLTQALAISPRGLILAIGRNEADAEHGHAHADHELPARIFLLVPVP